MIRKAVNLAVAVTAMATAAGVCLVALAYALFALVRPYLGSAGASAVVAGAAALVFLILALAMMAKARGPRHAHAAMPEDQGLAGRAIELAREKPILAAGAAAVAGLVLVRNPKLVTTLLTVMMAGKAGKVAGKAEERRR